VGSKEITMNPTATPLHTVDPDIDPADWWPR
jgi:hypothetical protein